ncbi:MAG: hypothetical protein LUG89_00800 [Methanosphaera sp.]|nr:hypothetical protein [Methanosphaera sp.]
MSFIGNIKNKLINSSNSYQYYKSNSQKLENKVKYLDKQIEGLKHENALLFKENEDLRHQNMNLEKYNSNYLILSDEISNLREDLKMDVTSINKRTEELIKVSEYNFVATSNNLIELKSESEDLNNYVKESIEE